MSLLSSSTKLLTNNIGKYLKSSGSPDFPPIWFTYDATKYASNPVLTKGGVGTFDSLGLRDPNMMIDVNGYLVKESGNIIMYYSGYKSASPHYEREIGRAVSSDGINWTKYASNPVLTKGSVGEWDEFGVQYANVIKLGSGSYIICYSGVNNNWSDADSWGIGIATSTDGINWTKYASNPVLSKANFTGITGNNIVTFPYMIKIASGNYVMLLSATFGAGDVFQFYGATSSDGFTWTALNSGNPVFSPGGAGWDKDNIEGPRIYEVGLNKYLLSYHGDPGGTDNGKMKLMLAYSENLISWTRSTNNPILSPTVGAWDAYRVENFVLAKDDFDKETIRFWYSGAPTGDGEDESAIGYGTIS